MAKRLLSRREWEKLISQPEIKKAHDEYMLAMSKLPSLRRMSKMDHHLFDHHQCQLCGTIWLWGIHFLYLNYTMASKETATQRFQEQWQEYSQMANVFLYIDYDCSNCTQLGDDDAGCELFNPFKKEPIKKTKSAAKK